MARYTGPRSKISRRFSEPIFGFSKALERKNYAPGQHGKTRRTKPKEYGTQLMEKQKVKFTYGVLERQFRRIFANAAKMKGATGENLMRLLEARLDNTVFRMGFAPSRRSARQMVSHKHILVNNEVVNIPSYSLKPGDMIEVRERSKSIEIIAQTASARVVRFSWLDVDKNKLVGKFLNYPERTDIPENVKERLVVELYSR